MAIPRFRYPLGELNETSDFLRIGIVDYTKSGLTRGSNPSGSVGAAGTTTSFTAGAPYTVNQNGRKNKKAFIATIILPIPSNIQDGNSVKYTEGNLDGLTAQALGIVQDAFSDRNPNRDPGTILADALKRGTNVISDPGAREYFLRGLAADAANIPFGGNLTASQLLARQTGNILNPNMELLFDGVTLRSFKFSFKLTPRNKDEAMAVKNIIRTLKKSMSPGYSQEGFDGTSRIKNLYLSTPKIFELTYMKGRSPHPFLHRFKQCFLTDMSVNQTGEGTYATYGGLPKDGGGTPVSMVMDLGFKELEPIYAGDYDPEKDSNRNIKRAAPGGVGY